MLCKLWLSSSLVFCVYAVSLMQFSTVRHLITDFCIREKSNHEILVSDVARSGTDACRTTNRQHCLTFRVLDGVYRLQTRLPVTIILH